MASLMDTYEQQYSTISADITSKIGQIPNLTGPAKADEKRNAVLGVEKLLEETKELLEQMDLEARELEPKDKQKYTTRLRSYKAELNKLEKDLKRSRIAFGDDLRAREDLLGGEESNYSEDQRQRLLDNSDLMERSSKRLDQGYKTALETEEIGNQILGDLATQRETIQRSRDRLRETDHGLGKSSRILTGMVRRIMQNRVLLFVIGFVMVLVIVVAIYLMAARHR